MRWIRFRWNSLLSRTRGYLWRHGRLWSLAGIAKRHAHGIWTHRQTGFWLWVVLAAFGVWVYFRPSPGSATTVLGAAAAVMTVREMQHAQKVFWTLLVFALLGIELRAINNERNEQRQALERDHQRHERERKSEDDRFGEILGRNQAGFDATMRAFATQLRELNRLGQLSKENISSITGGTDYVHFEAVPIPDGTDLSLMAIVSGTHVQREVTYEMAEGRNLGFSEEIARRDVADILSGRQRKGVTVGRLGTLVPGRATIVRVLHPSLTDGGYYGFNILALNGWVHETIEVRYNQVRRAWETQFIVKRGNKTLIKAAWH